MIRFIIFCFCVLTLFSAVLAEIVQPIHCDESDNKKCEVVNLRINPCKEALKTPVKPCKFKKNKVAEVEIDFVPSFAGNNLTAQLYSETGIADVPMPTMETDACKTTQCPSIIGTQQTYKYDMNIHKSYPTGSFDVKLILYGDNPEEEKCCVRFKAKIV